MKNRTPIMTVIAISLTAILLLSLLGICVSADTSTSNQAFDISAKSAALYVPKTGEMLYSKNPDMRLPMASTTKIMTALVTVSECELSDTVRVDECAVGTEGSSAYLKEGELLSIEELLYALMLQSANDAATALAYHISGGIEEFSVLMNEKASELKLSDTHFSNPHGLDAEDHYTTARDLAIIAAKALDNPILREITSTYKKSFITEERRRTYVNHNKLLLDLEGAIGVKTGYTKRCGRCLVGAVERDGLTLVSVTLDAPNDWSDHKKMIEFGYSAIESISLAKAGEIRYDLPVVNGNRQRIGVFNISDASVIAPKKDHTIDTQVRLTRYVCAPVKKGDVLGSIAFIVDGELVAESKLVAENDVKIKKESGLFGALFG